MTHPLEKFLRYVFQKKELLSLALTHKSMRSKNKLSVFERLEFLGDRILGLSIADILYNTYDKEKEGDLAKRFSLLVSKESCLKVAENISLASYIQVGRAGVTANSHILSDGIESVLGAIYLDGGFDAAKQVVAFLWKELLTENLTPPRESKSSLQEWTQSHLKTTPTYTLINVTGPDHAPLFQVKASVEIAKHVIKEAMGEGITKRQAEQMAAHSLLKDFKNQ